MLRRVVLPAGALDETPGVVALPPSVVHHVRVLRLTVGTELELTDGDGREAEGRLTYLGRDGGRADVGPARRVPPAIPKLVLLQGIGKGEKLDQVVRQAAELGVSRFVPVLSARAVARHDKKVDRLRAIADEALRVSRGAYRMGVDPPSTLGAAIEIPAELRLVLVPAAPDGLRVVLEGTPGAREVSVLVGPEGGFDEAEIALAEASGFRAAHLGPLILRTETAGPAAIAMLNYALRG